MIHQYFEAQGAKVVSVLVLRENNKSKGFGFVTFYEQEGVKIAITKKHIIQGRVVCPIFSITLSFLTIRYLVK
jgi:RNA recognition motif-containing protein